MRASTGELISDVMAETRYNNENQTPAEVDDYNCSNQASREVLKDASLGRSVPRHFVEEHSPTRSRRALYATDSRIPKSKKQALAKVVVDRSDMTHKKIKLPKISETTTAQALVSKVQRATEVRLDGSVDFDQMRRDLFLEAEVVEKETRPRLIPEPSLVLAQKCSITNSQTQKTSPAVQKIRR